MAQSAASRMRRSPWALVLLLASCLGTAPRADARDSTCAAAAPDWRLVVVANNEGDGFFESFVRAFGAATPTQSVEVVVVYQQHAQHDLYNFPAWRGTRLFHLSRGSVRQLPIRAFADARFGHPRLSFGTPRPLHIALGACARLPPAKHTALFTLGHGWAWQGLVRDFATRCGHQRGTRPAPGVHPPIRDLLNPAELASAIGAWQDYTGRRLDLYAGVHCGCACTALLEHLHGHVRWVFASGGYVVPAALPIADVIREMDKKSPVSGEAMGRLLVDRYKMPGDSCNVGGDGRPYDVGESVALLDTRAWPALEQDMAHFATTVEKTIGKEPGKATRVQRGLRKQLRQAWARSCATSCIGGSCATRGATTCCMRDLGLFLRAASGVTSGDVAAHRAIRSSARNAVRSYELVVRHVSSCPRPCDCTCDHSLTGLSTFFPCDNRDLAKYMRAGQGCYTGWSDLIYAMFPQDTGGNVDCPPSGPSGPAGSLARLAEGGLLVELSQGSLQDYKCAQLVIARAPDGPTRGMRIWSRLPVRLPRGPVRRVRVDWQGVVPVLQDEQGLQTLLTLYRCAHCASGPSERWLGRARVMWRLDSGTFAARDVSVAVEGVDPDSSGRVLRLIGLPEHSAGMSLRSVTREDQLMPPDSDDQTAPPGVSESPISAAARVRMHRLEEEFARSRVVLGIELQDEWGQSVSCVGGLDGRSRFPQRACGRAGFARRPREVGQRTRLQS